MTMLAFLCLAFVVSGAAGLIYESIWTRYLGLLVGHSAYAQVLVLVIFLGGMSLGALGVGRRGERVRHPLRWYAAVEVVVGLIGLLFHDIFVWTTHVLYDSVFPSLGPGALHVVVKWSVAALLILPQSVLLGATFPLMTAGALRRSRDGAGRKISLLYFANSLGAAVGVLLAGFYLIDIAGLPGTLLAAAMANIAVAGAVFMADRRAPASDDESAVVSTEARTGAEVSASIRRLLLVVSFGTAVSSFIYEIGWIRMLSLVLGAATHSFELMLSAFILGLAIGAFVIRRRAGDDTHALMRLARVQLAMGMLAAATLPVYMRSFQWMADFMAAFSRSPAGYTAFSLSRYAICLAVMLPATICAGMTLPLITRLLLRGPNGERALGQVYGVNTLGSIVGVALAVLVVLPTFGLKWMIVLGAMIDVALGAWLITASADRPRARVLRRPALLAAAAGALVLLFGVSTRFDRGVLSSGVFRYGVARSTATPNMVFFSDGRTATVTVRRIPASNGLSLATNGKPDASLGPEWFLPPATPTRFTHDASTQTLVPLVALAHVPQARVAAIIGQGSGMSSHALLGARGLKRVVTIELEPEMVRASRAFYPANRRVFDDPRSSFAYDDARSYFAAAGERFDLIVSEPSNPWVAGVSGLFTTEFYGHVRRYMNPGGVFAQWVHVSEMHDGLVLSVVRALAENFPDYALYNVSNHDLLIVASKEGRLRAPDWSVFADSAVAEDYKRVLPITPEMFDALRVADASTFAPLVGGGGANSDFYPTLDLGAERSRYLKEEASGFVSLSGDRYGLARLLEQRRAVAGVTPYTVVGGVPRLEAMELAARVRGGNFAGADPTQVIAAGRVRATRRMLATGEAPIDWRAWVETVRDAEETIAGGSAGVDDVAFFAEVHRYLERHPTAPREARAAVDFLHGLASWDYPRSASAANVLLDAASRGDFWLSPDLLGDGAVVAYLKSGNLAAARAAYPLVAGSTTRGEHDLRRELLGAWILAASGPHPQETASR
ncbi:MAG: fused MFS/spermidine synthase [Gemmatimonadaceae bacterium]|nr:fused MFS/spermidine synthase [Gemmatimonadaceae bacterium]NUQ93388.1 fused MFS/spermidine synthase [Gemmatimonadaceae bacterium]NUS96560.1 fused MFS/spermidine synthase [Gemmatimonadaceae bacterium]